jgi:predicted transcriptional regulator YdeE
MEPRFVERYPIRLIGILTAGKPEEIVPHLNEIWMDRFMKYDELLKPYSSDKAYYGAWTWTVPGVQQAYMAGMAVEGLAQIPDGLEEIILPAARYAVFDATVSTFGVVYDEIYNQWLPSSPYEYDIMAADFEYYPPNTENGDSPTQIYIPIKTRTPA